MTDKVFIDSNVWIYLYSADDARKRIIAEKFIADSGRKSAFVISYQVINEVTNVLGKKGFSEQEIRDTVELLAKICVIQEASKDMLLLSSRFRETYSLSFWDSHIVAAAVTARCGLLVSEDMQDGLTVDGVLIQNIFAGG